MGIAELSPALARCSASPSMILHQLFGAGRHQRAPQYPRTGERLTGYFTGSMRLPGWPWASCFRVPSPVLCQQSHGTGTSGAPPFFTDDATGPCISRHMASAGTVLGLTKAKCGAKATVASRSGNWSR